MTKYHEEDYAIFPKSGCGIGIKTDHGEAEGKPWREVDGLCETPQGFVRVHSWLWVGRYKGSDVSMIVNGRYYSRRWHNVAYSGRGLVTKAKQFARELEERLAQQEGGSDGAD